MTIAKKYDVPKKLFDGGKIIPGLLLFVLVVALPALYTCAAGGQKTQPTLHRPKVVDGCTPGTKDCGCVEDLAYMRSNHMALLNEWRDSAIRDGKRFYISDRWGSKHPISISLTDTCLRCHESKADFCDKCHSYAGVEPYCWTCHLAEGEE